MRSKRLVFVLMIAAFALCVPFVANGQETTGSIEITTKDANGAIVPNVAVTVESAGQNAGFRRTVTTDDEGVARVLQVPPGAYKVSTAATGGFVAKTLPEVYVNLGKATVVNFPMATSVTADVTVSAGEIAPVDTTDTKIQTTVSRETAELLPKGVSFASVLKVSPATRSEPLNGGFQIDGASGSENVFVIDGQEVSNVRTGTLDGTANIPLSLVQEVQVKSSGFQAEYGGATGGVVTVVTRGGSNEWHGEFGTQFQVADLQARGRSILRENALVSPSVAEYFPQGRDGGTNFFPTAVVSGPVVKNRLWFIAGFSPQIFEGNRTITYLNPLTRVPAGPVVTYSGKSTYEYDFLRFDAQPFSKLRINAQYLYNPFHTLGTIPSYTDALNCTTTTPSTCTLPNGNGLSGLAYTSQVGGRNNSQSVTGQATWTPTSNLVIGFRAGHYFLNEKSGSYGIGDIKQERVTCSASSPTQFPAGFGCVRGFNNGLPVNSNVLFDATKRRTADADVTYLFSGLGRHELKGGYQYNGIANQVDSTTRSQIVLRYGQSIASYSGVAALQSSPTAVGAGLLRIFGEAGDVSSANQAFYVQDKWQPASRLTLLLGLRAEKEDVPSFKEGLSGIKFNYGDKIAPRIGVAFDLTGDGKTKISGFYGWFYDRFKYELPRGSFGGAYFHDFYYEIQPGDTLASFTYANITGSASFTGTPGGKCPTTTTTPSPGRIRCDFDFRVPSNAGLGLEFGAIDPNLKAFRESTYEFTFERQLGNSYVTSARYIHKQVDHTVEDAGFLTSTGSEAYIIGNPGEGLYQQLAEQNGLLNLKPKRNYDALEVRLDRRFANNWFFNANYTWSRLFGNYSGLASSDEDGRTSPNVNRFFDLPHAGYTVAGGKDDGRLATDRPHAVKFFGAYNLNWDKLFGFGGNNETLLGVYTTVQSGTPVTSTVDILNIDTIVLSKRGDLGRTEAYTQTDFTFRHSYKFGSDKRYKLIFESDILNLFNESNELSRQNLISITNYDLRDPSLGLITAAEAGQPNAAVLAMARFQRNGSSALTTLASSAGQRYVLYNKTNSFQGPRSVRFGFRFLF